MIVISSDSEGSGDDSGELIIREYLERHRSRCQTSSIASNMTFDTNDSNAERVYEYGADRFNTEPEISFTPSTHSKAEPQLGSEAESRFHSNAESTSSA